MSKVRPKSKAGFSVSIRQRIYAILRKKSNLYRKDTPLYEASTSANPSARAAAVLRAGAAAERLRRGEKLYHAADLCHGHRHGSDRLRQKADDGINAAISIINSMDKLLDPENERSKTYEINHAMGSPVVVNEQIAKMLRTAQTVYERTNGAFDPDDFIR